MHREAGMLSLDVKAKERRGKRWTHGTGCACSLRQDAACRLTPPDAQSVHCTAVSHQPFQPFCSMLGLGRVALVWLVTASSRIVTAGKPSCSLLLTGQGGAATYTITNTELNINFAAESIELAGLNQNHYFNIIQMAIMFSSNQELWLSVTFMYSHAD